MALSKYSPVGEEDLPDNQFINKVFDLLEKEPGHLSLAVSVRLTWCFYAMNLQPTEKVHGKLC